MEGVFRLSDQEIDAIASRVVEKMKSSHSLQSIDGANKMVAERLDNLRVAIARQLEGYRPVDDGDIGKVVEVQNSTAEPWRECTLLAIDWGRPYGRGFLCRHGDPVVATQWRFARIKIEEPKKEAEPEHPAGPMPDPGEGYRILAKDPPERLLATDEGFFESWGWTFVKVSGGEQLDEIWYRRKIDEPAKQPEPAWEPKVGDLVKVTRPEYWKEWKDPQWRGEMHIYNGKFLRVENVLETSVGERVKLHGVDYFFHRDWLTPSIKHFAEPPAKEPQPVENPVGPMPDPEEGCRILAKDPLEKLRPGDEFWCRHRMAWIESVNARNGGGQASGFWYRRKIEPPASEEPPKPAEPQYRTPSLPEDAGKVCEFINDEDTNLWVEQRLYGYKDQEYLPWISEEGEWHQARIKIEDKSLPPKPSPDASVAMPEGKENPHISSSWSDFSSSWSGLFDWILNAKSTEGGSSSMRTPKIPDDFGKICQFSHREDMLDAKPFKLVGWRMGKWISDDTEFNSEGQAYQYCQIESPYHRR